MSSQDVPEQFLTHSHDDSPSELFKGRDKLPSNSGWKDVLVEARTAEAEKDRSAGVSLEEIRIGLKSTSPVIISLCNKISCFQFQNPGVKNDSLVPWITVSTPGDESPRSESCLEPDT